MRGGLVARGFGDAGAVFVIGSGSAFGASQAANATSPTTTKQQRRIVLAQKRPPTPA
jgi:hypothetical protein